MGPATLISLLILVVVASVVLKDLARMQTAAKPAPRPEDRPLVPAYGNDPMVVGLQAQVQQLSSQVGALVGAGVGAGLGRAAGAGVSTAEVELARGAGSHDISSDEAIDLARRAYTAGASTSAPATNVAAAIGAAIGSVVAVPISIVEGSFLAGAGGFDRLFKTADRLGIPKL